MMCIRTTLLSYGILPANDGADNDGADTFLQDIKRRIYEPPYESYALLVYKNSRDKLHLLIYSTLSKDHL